MKSDTASAEEVGHEPRVSSARIIAPVACAVALVAATAWWLLSTPSPILRDELRLSQFWILDAWFAILSLTTINACRELAGVVSWRDRAVMTALFLGTLLLVDLAPRTNRIFFDEQIYQGIAQNLSDLHLAQMCNEGTVEYGTLQCWRGEYNKQPYGYPQLLSIGYRIVGTSDRVAQRLNMGLTAGTAVLAFLIVLLATGDRRAAGFGGLALALMPEHLRWGHTASSEPSTAFFCALAVLAAVAFCRNPSTRLLIWTAAASSVAAYFRPEAILITVVVGLAMLVVRTRDLVRWSNAWVFVAWLIMLIPEVAHVVSVSGESWGAPGDRLSFAFVGANFVTNARFYVWDHRFPAALTIFAILGVSRQWTSLVLGTWFVALWGIFLFFYAGSYDYGADVRYSLLSGAPLAACAGLGASRVARWLGNAPLRLVRPSVAVLAVLLAQFLWYAPWVRAVGEEAWAARADVAYASEMRRGLPPNSIVLSHNPSMFQVSGVSAAQLSLATDDPRYVRETLAKRYAGGVYLHWNFWCNVADDRQTAFCRDALAAFPHQLVKEFRERDYRYALYKLDVQTGR